MDQHNNLPLVCTDCKGHGALMVTGSGWENCAKCHGTGTIPKPVRVVFRVWKKEKTVIALFPDLPFDYANKYCTAYEHIGQHGAADYYSVIARSRAALPEEYQALKRELESKPYEYVLRVVTRKYPLTI